MAKNYPCYLYSEEIKVRFANSGKLISVRKKQGESVKQGEIIASLDRKLLQAELDKQLADYEKTRAQFELFAIKYGKEDSDDTVKFLRQEKQSALNASVKEVEIAKIKLDQSDLISPVEGIILNLNDLVSNVHITPASSTVTILRTDSLVAIFEIQQQELEVFLTPQDIHVSITHLKRQYESRTIPPLVGKNGIFLITAVLHQSLDLLPGMKGTIQLKK